MGLKPGLEIENDSTLKNSFYAHGLEKGVIGYFQETRFFVWKFENFNELQLPYSLIFFPHILYTFST